MAKKQRKSISLRALFAITIVAYVASFLVLGAVMAVLTTIYGKTQNQGVLIGLIVFFFVYVAAFLVAGFFTVARLRRTYIDTAFGVTERNYARINQGRADLEEYQGANRVKEFASLNLAVDRVRSSLKNATLVFGNLDYNSFSLEWVDGYEGVATLESFEKQLSNIIASSLNFRNVIAEIYYELGDKGLDEEERKMIISALRTQFAHFEKTLVLLPKDRNSVYLYLPRIDSLSALCGRFDTLLSSLGISKHGIDGFTPLAPHYAMVVYPFSAVHELLPDLRYAKRQNKATNVYLPNRIHVASDVTIGKNAMELNQMSKILYNVASLEANETNKQAVRHGMARVFSLLNSELGFEMSGLIAYHQEVGGFVCLDHVGNEDIFSIGRTVDKEFLLAINEAVDPDHSFYFSTRDHVGPALGRYFDKMGVRSGFLYAMRKEGEIHGILYFLNTKRDLHFDSYIQEALSAACYHISSSYTHGILIEDSMAANRRYDALLAANDAVSYQIEKGSYQLLSFSRGAKRLFKNAEVGRPCHEVLYDLHSPCANCPLRTGNKMVGQIGKSQYATSLTIDISRGQTQTLLLKKIKTEEDSSNRYDPELLIPTFPTLYEELGNHFLTGDNGYLLLLRLDNYASLIERFGSEGFLLIQRAFIEALRAIGSNYDSFFRYDDKTMGLLFPACGQVDVINRCEEIYRCTKNITYQGEEKYDLDISYMPMNYPQGYAGAPDFFRHTTRDLYHRARPFGSDYIYFDDTDYVRPASRRDFMLSVIAEQFGKETFQVSLQPIMGMRGRKIEGAEILLRVQDEYRHIVFNPEELIRVAEENGQIPLITRALLRYVGNFYQSVGASTLKMFGFQQLALNTDVSLFADKSFEADFTKFLKETSLPDGFLSFEIAEGDVYRHLDAFRAAAPSLKKHKVHLVIDQYSGRNISLAECVSLGFEKIKVGRNVVHNIDTDQGRLQAITSLLNEAKEKNIATAVVGVENRDQFDLLMKINPAMEMQGYYFYRPLERSALLEAIRKNKNVE